jgi:hypothetical protein
MFSYTIGDNNTVLIHDSNTPQPEPCVVQPQWPRGDEWGSLAEAEAWATLYVEASNDSTVDPIPGHSPDAPTRPRPVKEAPEEEPAAEEAVA